MPAQKFTSHPATQRAVKKHVSSSIRWVQGTPRLYQRTSTRRRTARGWWRSLDEERRVCTVAEDHHVKPHLRTTTQAQAYTRLTRPPSSLCRTPRPRQQLRQQLGRPLRHLPRHRLDPRPHPQPYPRLHTNPTPHPSSHRRLVSFRPLPYHQHRFRRWSARPRPRNLRLQCQQSGITSSQQGVGAASGEEEYHE